jgi:hypothetical protein
MRVPEQGTGKFAPRIRLLVLVVAVMCFVVQFLDIHADITWHTLRYIPHTRIDSTLVVNQLGMGVAEAGFQAALLCVPILVMGLPGFCASPGAVREGDQTRGCA